MSKTKKIILSFLLTTFFVATKGLAYDSPIYSSYARFHPVVAQNGMVATQEKHATQVGLNILQEGGNAVDAAIGIAYSLAVTLPRAGNIGGGGFMLIYSKKDNKVYTIDYREKAPAAAHKDMFLNPDGSMNNDLSRNSLKASGVPGTVAGLELAYKKFASLPRKDLIEPAIRLAKDGFTVGHDLARSLEVARPRMKASPASMKIFYSKEGIAPKLGTKLVQKDLAKSLKLISKKGEKGFYEGAMAKKIVKFMKKNDGLITSDDLKNYKAILREPIKGQYKNYTIYSMPPPSSGGIHLVQLLNILENFPLRIEGHNSAESIHLMVEAMKYAYADRSKHLGDPDFIDVPLYDLLSKEYSLKIAKSIQRDKTTSSNRILPSSFKKQYNEGDETTHFTVMDRFGNIVSNTYTLNFSYGNKIVVPGTGMLLNNQMDDFSAKPGVKNAYGLIGGAANKIEPNKRMLSSMTPTIVFKDGEPYLATGTPGGSRIITTILQVLLNTMEYNMNIAEASSAQRVHHQWLPDILFIEKGFNEDTKEKLIKKGHQIKETRAMGSTQSIVKENGYFFGYSDPRKEGALTKGF